LPKDKIIQIPIGFLPGTAKNPRRKMSKTDEFKIVVVSRLNLEKNLIFALEVLSELRKIDDSISVSFYGNGPELSKLLDYRKVFKLEHIVDFKGFEENLSSVYPSFDLLLHTSRTEGFCQVVVEALASGLKVFSSYVGVVQDLRSLDTPNLEVFDLTADAFTVASQLHNFICQPIVKNPQLGIILNRFSFENMKLGIDSSIKIMRSGKIIEDS
jgi:glycosyltransferase involved in cell wall biosynthesis